MYLGFFRNVGLIYFVYRHTKLCKFFNAEYILVDYQWDYLTHSSGGDEGIHTFH